MSLDELGADEAILKVLNYLLFFDDLMMTLTSPRALTTIWTISISCWLLQPIETRPLPASTIAPSHIAGSNPLLPTGLHLLPVGG
jgi:hypothetical protein